MYLIIFLVQLRVHGGEGGGGGDSVLTHIGGFRGGDNNDFGPILHDRGSGGGGADCNVFGSILQRRPGEVAGGGAGGKMQRVWANTCKWISHESPVSINSLPGV